MHDTILRLEQEAEIRHRIASDAIDSLRVRERFDEWKLISMKQDETEAYLRSVIHVTRETIEKNRDISSLA